MDDLPRRIANAAVPLPDIDNPAFADAFDRYADARVVLLGEASHGTSEFYRARAAITRRLIERHGFDIVAVEADWPDAAALNRRVRGLPERDGDDAVFARFPHWMWRNREVEALLDWMTEWNRGRVDGEQAGFYGLDLYNLGGSMRAVIDYLDEVDPEIAGEARERYGCMMPWAQDPARYGRAALSGRHASCEREVLNMLSEMLSGRLERMGEDGDALLDAQANARLVANAEAYYRVMYHGAAESWNLRDSHMFETLCQVLEARGRRSKAIVWAHNSHIGDARFTDMGWSRGEHNIGQLVRQRFSEDSVLIGFGTHAGTVAAADDWDGPMRIKTVNPSMPGSVERLCHDAGNPSFLLDLRGADGGLASALAEPRLERYIGVIYRPQTERWSHYAESSLSRQYDAWAWFDETRAVSALREPVVPTAAHEDETYPFGI